MNALEKATIQIRLYKARADSEIESVHKWVFSRLVHETMKLPIFGFNCFSKMNCCFNRERLKNAELEVTLRCQKEEFDRCDKGNMKWTNFPESVTQKFDVQCFVWIFPQNGHAIRQVERSESRTGWANCKVRRWKNCSKFKWPSFVGTFVQQMWKKQNFFFKECNGSKPNCSKGSRGRRRRWGKDWWSSRARSRTCGAETFSGRGGSAKPFGESTNTKSLRAGGSANSRHFPARGKKASVGEESPTLLSVQGKMGGEAKSFRTTGTAALICSNCQGLTDIRPLDFVAKVLEILIMLAERKIHDRTTLWESPFISVCSPLPQHDHRIWTDVSCYNSPWRYSILGEFSHALFCWGQIYVSFNGISIA